MGVVVFDAGTGAPKSFNRETRRIVDSPRNPDQSPEDLLSVVTFRRADGREVSLRQPPLVFHQRGLIPGLSMMSFLG